MAEVSFRSGQSGIPGRNGPCYGWTTEASENRRNTFRGKFSNLNCCCETERSNPRTTSTTQARAVQHQWERLTNPAKKGMRNRVSITSGAWGTLSEQAKRGCRMLWFWKRAGFVPKGNSWSTSGNLACPLTVRLFLEAALYVHFTSVIEIGAEP